MKKPRWRAIDKAMLLSGHKYDSEVCIRNFDNSLQTFVNKLKYKKEKGDKQ
ncbi:hypothetical protein [Bacillus pseudomycoides]|uniref:hypothetical protein n=1 Tax=Bacillus pseudomycoides TaxID=64104 RepID=UPI00159658E8|nr:hypothetical protein [Bacillus pseudomycoides]